MSDVTVGMMSASAALGLVGTGIAVGGARRMDDPPEFTFRSLENLITADNTPPGPALEHAKGDIRIGGKVLDANHEFAVMAQNGQLDNIAMLKRDSAGKVVPTAFSLDLAKMSNNVGKHAPGRTMMIAGGAMLGVGVLGFMIGLGAHTPERTP